MNGKPISATLWHVHYTYKREKASTILDAEGNRQGPEFVHGGPINVATADPTGADLCKVACDMVKQSESHPEQVSEFTLIHVHRAGDFRGRAIVEEEPAS